MASTSLLFLVFHWTEKPFSFFRNSIFFHYTIYPQNMIIRSRYFQPILAMLSLCHLDAIQALIDSQTASCDHPRNYSDFTVLLVNNTIIATGGNAVSWYLNNHYLLFIDRIATYGSVAARLIKWPGHSSQLLDKSFGRQHWSRSNKHHCNIVSTIQARHWVQSVRRLICCSRRR